MICLIAGKVVLCSDHYDIQTCENKFVELFCHHNITDPKSIEWFIYDVNVREQRIVSRDSQKITSNPDSYQVINFDYSTGNLKMNVSKNNSQNYICRTLPADGPPIPTVQSNNTLTVSSCSKYIYNLILCM